MLDNRKEYAKLQKKIKSLRRRVAELEKNEPRHSRMGVPPKNDLLYQTLMENIHFGISFMDTNHRVVTTNVSLGKFFRKPRSEFVGKYCFREFEKRDAVCSHCPGTRAMATGRPAEVETEGVRDDGSRFAVHLRAFPVFEADGTIKGFIEIVEDITEYKQAIFDNAADGILLADVENKKFYIGNKAICKMLGYKPEEIKNLAVFDIHPKEHLPYVIEQFEKQARREITMAEDLPVKRKNGSVFYADISSFPITLGGKTYLMGIFRDVTERRKAKEELRQAEAKYRALVEQIPAVTYTAALDKASTTTYVSPQILKLIGFTPQEYKADPDIWRKQLHPDDRKRVLDSLYRSQKGKQPFNCEYRMLSKDGKVVWCRDEAVVVRDSSGQPLMLQGVMFDITAQKRAEEELNTYREKMAQAERLASLGTLSATIAHELTQPLTVIRLSIENSLEDLEPTSCCKTVKDVLKDALNEVTNATSAVERFRSYARQSSKKTFCETNLVAVADRIIKLLGKTAQRAKMTLHLKDMDKLPPAYSNEKDLEQLFFALTENAIQAADGKKNRRLIIEGAVKDKNIELRFSDNCRGIAPENLNKIFDPFFTTGPDDGRTGLGLPIVQRILSEHGGKIRVQSRLGKGTTFYVTLPVHSEIVK
jgi:PAS domain S-box-containing protein